MRRFAALLTLLLAFSLTAVSGTPAQDCCHKSKKSARSKMTCSLTNKEVDKCCCEKKDGKFYCTLAKKTVEECCCKKA